MHAPEVLLGPKHKNPVAVALHHCNPLRVCLHKNLHFPSLACEVLSTSVVRGGGVANTLFLQSLSPIPLPPNSQCVSESLLFYTSRANLSSGKFTRSYLKIPRSRGITAQE